MDGLKAGVANNGRKSLITKKNAIKETTKLNRK